MTKKIFFNSYSFFTIVVLRIVAVCLITYMVLMISGCSPPNDAARQSMPGTKMAEANQLYESGAYDEAVGVYQSLIDAGVMDGAVNYNLGNAYFKIGDIGRAILNYRRAQRLLPRDPDINANLQLAQVQTRDRLEGEGNELSGFIRNILVDWSTLNEIAGITLGIWLLLCGCAMVALLRRNKSQILLWIMVFLVMGLLLSMLSFGAQLLDARKDYGVIVASSIEVRSGPGGNYLVEFSLHSGTEVQVLEYRNAWARITLPGNLQGWVPDETVDSIKNY